MRWNKIFLTIKKELRAIVRDKKSFLIILLTPFIVPAFVLGMSALYEVMFSDMDSGSVVGVNYELNSNEKSIVTEINLDVNKYDSIDSMNDAYEDGLIDAYIYLDNGTYNIYGNIDDMDSSQAISYIEAYLSAYNNFLAENYLLGEDIEPDLVFNIINYEIVQLEGDNYLVELLLEVALPYVIMVVAMTATTCATDLTAGEKEKGTLETLLTFPIKSGEIIFGKFLAISTACVLSGIFSFILALLSLNISISAFDLFEGVVFNVSLSKIIMGILIIISSALIISGLCIAIASRSKSFKEAQSSLQPIQFLVLVPLLLPMAKVETNLLISIIPMVGQGMLLNDLFGNTVTYLNVISMFISSIIFIFLIIWIISKQYKSEKVLFF